MVEVYPDPTSVIVNWETLSSEINAVAVALESPALIVTDGTKEYPIPVLVISNESIFPVSETIAVAEALTTLSWDMIRILLW